MITTGATTIRSTVGIPVSPPRPTMPLRPVPPAAAGTRLGWRGTGRVLACLVAVIALGVGVVRWTSPPEELAMEFLDGSAWLPSLRLGGVSLLDGSRGAEVAALTVADRDDDFEVTQWGSDAIVVNSTSRTIGRLDGATWRLDDGIRLDGYTRPRIDLVVGRHDAWLLDDGRITAIDLESLRSRPPVEIVDRPVEGLVLDDGTLLSAGAGPGAGVWRLAPAGSGEPVSGIDGPVRFERLDAGAVAVDGDDGRLWIDGRGVVCEHLGFDPDPEPGPASDGTNLAVVGADGSVTAWAPGERACPGTEDRHPTGLDDPGQPVLTDGWLVVPDRAGPRVASIDLAAGTAPELIDLPTPDTGSPIELVAESGSVWFNDPSSDVAGLIHRDGTVELVSKYDTGDGGGFTSASAADEAVLTDDDRDDDTPTDDADQADDGTDPGDGATEDPNPDTSPEEDGAAETVGQQTPDDPDPTGPADGTEPSEVPGPTTLVTQDPSPEVEPEPEPGVLSQTEPEPEPGEGVQVRLRQSATQVVVGDTVAFETSISNGAPTAFTFSASPAGPVVTNQTGPAVRYRFDGPGTYTVTVSACDGDDCDEAAARVDVVSASDDVVLSAHIVDPGQVVAGSPVRLGHASEGDVTGVSWSFPTGSPSSSTAEAPSVQWDTPGTHTVTLSVSGPGGATSTTSRQVRVVAAPQPYTINLAGPVTVTAGQQATYVASADAPLDDLRFVTSGATGVVRSGSSIGLVWPDPGTFTISASAGPDGLGTGSLTVTVEAEPEPPVIGLTGPATVDTGTPAAFTVTNTGGPVDRYTWQVDGADVTAPVGDTLTTSWTTVGDHSVTVTAHPPTVGGTTPTPVSATATVTVTEAGLQAPLDVACPVGDITYNSGDGTELAPDSINWEATLSFTDPNTPPRPHRIELYNTATGITQYIDLAPGETSYLLAITTHRYRFDVIELQAVGDNGETAAVSLAMCHNLPAVVTGAIQAPASGTVGSPVSFSAVDSSTTPATDYSWDFGDGTTSTAANPTHTYSAPGTYQVEVVVHSEGIDGFGAGTGNTRQWITLSFTVS